MVGVLIFVASDEPLDESSLFAHENKLKTINNTKNNSNLIFFFIINK